MQLDHYSLEDLKKMKKYKLKKMIKKAIKTKAFQYLQLEKNKKKKIKNIHYTNLELQQYLKTDKISLRRKKLLFRTRTRMLRVESNYGKKQSCPVCLSSSLDNQEHLINCSVLKISCPELINIKSSYDDIYSKDIEKMSEVIRMIEIAIRKREELQQAK